MTVSFEDITNALYEHSPFSKNPKKKLINIKEYHLYPLGILVSAGPAYITDDSLMRLKENGLAVGIDLKQGLVEFGENSIYFRFPGTFEGIVDGKKVFGVMVGGNVGPNIKDQPKKEDIINIKDSLMILKDKKLLKDYPDYLDNP